MPIVVDTHVHIYPEYDSERLLNDAAARLQDLAPGATPAICLTERAGQHVYADWAMLPTVPGTDLPIERIEGRGGVALRVGTASGDLFVLPGRQIATAERLEVLILGRDLEVADGTPAADAICAGLDAGAIPVLTWAFGKWWFKRSRVVRSLVRHFIPERLWLGDTTMRPREWPSGRIMRRAVANGARVLAGSDPLPGKSEAHHAGRYATLIATSLEPRDPAGSILRGLRVLPPGGHTLGRRCGLPTILMRMSRRKG
ncbi:MAG: hypothetical protein QGH42_08170 [Kiritimatiellia bacterium]|jgi:hypothetical protein|nr:hypothetical protein [Kiritimatiellia bacterium]MDP6630350.1 hypothetical protein [Kiritimatiellia bacterium]MDP6810856.1 hypothetical protein [Kiritimatiellia bacterium]MDP7024199.1 hypothetical protein [Kiritimatiellia bacterium]